MKRPKEAICSFCRQTIKRRKLLTHWREDCPTVPELSKGQYICTLCQQPKEFADFPPAPIPRGIMYRCRKCHHVEEAHRKATKQVGNPNSRKYVKPSSWILIPCKFCGTKFSTKEMRRHLTFCEKHTKRKPWKATNTTPPIKNMEEAKAAYESDQRKVKARTIRFQYGLTLADYDALVIAHSGRCGICGIADNGSSRGDGGIYIDHDHATRKVRGLLCSNCNHLLGNCKESVALLLKAIEYLLRHKPVGVVS